MSTNVTSIKLKVLGFGAAAVIGATILLGATNSATAATCQFGSSIYSGGNPGGADLTTSTACVLYDGDNDTPAIVAANEPFGITDWVLADKTDDNSSGDQSIVLSTFTGAGTSDGSWGVSSFNGADSVFLTIKAGNGFAAYLLNLDFTTGLWTTDNIFPDGSENDGKDISHMSLYYSGTISVVPIPAALPLFGAALLGLAFLSRRRKIKAKQA
ncbi:MAG: VPLPA-CTERM sorting domain-containing protein [Sneathiella sp.]